MMPYRMAVTVPPIRQLTPPESPRSQEHALLPPIKTSWHDDNRGKPTGKMSLDFIAPSSRSVSPESAPKAVLPPIRLLDVLSDAAAMHRRSRPSSPLQHAAPPPNPHALHNSPFFLRPQPAIKDEYLTPVSTQSGSLPSPVYSAYAEPLSARDLYAIQMHWSNSDRRRSEAASGHGILSRSAVYTPPGMRPSRVQKRSPRIQQSIAAARTERHIYDPEEKYALIYWRREIGQKKLEWKDCLERYLYLFPEGQPRRWKPKDSAEARGLPDHYPDRNLQGLQCRFYRIRSEEGMPKTREAMANVSLNSSAAREAIELELEKLHDVVVRHNLDANFVRLVHQLGEKGPLRETGSRARL